MEAVQSVWLDNFDEESLVLREAASHARHVALNVQYPGCVVQSPAGRNHNDLTADERYAVVRANVDALKPLQVGLAICTTDDRILAWEFNLRGFDAASDDKRDPRSIAYLALLGLDFKKLPSDGIEASKLRGLLSDSGLLGAETPLATFTGAYHVSYFLDMMIDDPLPAGLDAFMATVRDQLGPVYDVKRVAKEHGCLGSLKLTAKQLDVPVPEGVPELAGSGSVLALLCFEALKEKLGDDLEKYRDQLCGLQTG